MRRIRILVSGLALFVACTAAEPVEPSTSTSVTHAPSSTLRGPTTTTAAPVTSTTAVEACPLSPFSLDVVELSPGEDPGSPDLDGATVVYTFGEPPSGPNAIDVAPDGSVWIADTEAARLGAPRLIRIGCEGPPGEVVDLSHHGVVSAFDLVVDAEGAWVAAFDVARDRYRLIKVDASGTLLADHEIPEGFRLFDGFAGLQQGEDGSVLLLRGGESRPHVFIDALGMAIDPPTEGEWATRGVEVDLDGEVRIGEVSVPVELPNVFAGASYLGSTPEGDTLLVLTELHDGPTLLVDETVWRITPKGEVVAMGRVPIAERYLYLEHPLAVSPTGEVVVMLALPDELQVYPMELLPHLDPVLPPPGG